MYTYIYVYIYIYRANKKNVLRMTQSHRAHFTRCHLTLQVSPTYEQNEADFETA